MIKTVMLSFGTRPEAVKMCPLVNELKSRSQIRTLVCVSGQHKEMLRQVLEVFGVEPDYDLSVMKDRQTLTSVTAEILSGMDRILKKEKPDMVLVHGDTTSTLAVALACFYLQIPVGHVEAGLRTYNIWSPYPEEFNRQAVGILASCHFSPTAASAENLLLEGKRKETVFVTGNTGIDAMRTTIRKEYHHTELAWAGGSRLILLTAHRRESIGAPLFHIFSAIRRVVDENPDIKVIYPVHPNPAVKEMAKKVLGGHERIHLIEPLGVLDFHNFLYRSSMVLTDSGGIQEEAPGLGKPVLVMRENTERPEGVKAGTLRLTGTGEESVYGAFGLLLHDQTEYDRMSMASNPYGDGYASQRIADIVEELLVRQKNGGF